MSIPSVVSMKVSMKDAVLAAVQAVLDAVAAAQLALVPPGLTAPVLPRFVKSTT